MSALASSERFGGEDLVFIHCLQNEWPLTIKSKAPIKLDLRYLLTYIAILTWKQKIALRENLIRSARQGHNRPIDVTLPLRMFGVGCFLLEKE